jgi:NTE family protein
MSASTSPRIAVALGAGGARGLAHLSVLEALDEMGLKPVLVTGASIGAIVGAAYCSGIKAKALKAHVALGFRDRARVIARLLEARVGRIADLWKGGLGNPVLLDAERVLDLFWPQAVPDRFEALAIPFEAVASDYHLRREVRIGTGPLTPAVAASMAIPGLLKPVTMAGQVLIDGGATNPLPYDQMPPGIDLVIAVDSGGAAFVSDRRAPEPFEAMIGASQILMNQLLQRMIERAPPDLLIRPPVDAFGGLEFFRAAEIMAAGDSIKDQVKRQVEERLKRL